MRFAEVRRRLIEALEDGAWEAEAREAVAEKNLLAIGEVDAALVIGLLQSGVRDS